MSTRKTIYILAVICLFFLYACGPKAVAPKAELDTPEHHVANGKKLLNAGKLDDAFKEFSRARGLDPKHAPAYIGQGLVFGFRSDFRNAFSHMKAGKKYAEGPEEELSVLIGYMRLYIQGREKVEENWLKEVSKLYKKATKLAPDSPEPYYYMGLAYKMSYEFRKASAEFTKVLDLNKGFAAEADREYKIIQRIERAMPGTTVGKKIALLEAITRADVAALFIEELNIGELFKRRTPKKFDTSFKEPEKEFKTGSYEKIAEATDIADHVLKVDIDLVMEIGIKGLQAYPDHTFKPYQNVSRAEYAMMIEDILVKITRDEKLATLFIGNNSPFPDLRNDLPYFNAVMVCTTRGILETADMGTGEFNPMGNVSGADALLSIRALKSQLKNF